MHTVGKILKFHFTKKEIEIEENNYNAWLQGIYVLSALNQSLSNSFGKKRNNKIYPQNPIDLKSKDNDKKVLTKKDKEKLMVEDFNKWARI